MILNFYLNLNEIHGLAKICMNFALSARGETKNYVKKQFYRVIVILYLPLGALGNVPCPLTAKKQSIMRR